MSRVKNYIYVDISIAENSLHQTGIQRVVREFCKNFKKNQGEDLVIKYINVNNKNNGIEVDPFMNANNFISLQLKLTNIINSLKRLVYIIFSKRIASKIASLTTRYFHIKDIYNDIVLNEENSNHTLLLLDSNWTRDALILSKLFSGDGHKVVSIFYDLSPIIEPKYFEEGIAKNFKNYWFAQIKQTDLVLSISNTISIEFEEYVKKNNLQTKEGIKFDFFKLGCNFYNTKALKTNVIRDKNKYLVVGSIEPRKNVSTVLNAFELLWKDNHNLILTIAYNNSWHEDAFVSRIKNHPMMNKRLFLIYGSSDRELVIEYHSSYALISSSIYEGYGLGLAEALNFGCKVFASNIPVYKELYKENAIFFENNSVDLKCSIISDINKKSVIKKFKPTSWQAASKLLLRKTVGK